MPYNPKSLKNLKRGNYTGRPKLLCNVIKEIPPDARERIYATLHFALKQPNRKAVLEFLKEKEDDLGEYGFVLQRAAAELTGKYGWTAMMDILDRLFGKPHQSTHVTGTVGVGDKPVIIFKSEREDEKEPEGE